MYFVMYNSIVQVQVQAKVPTKYIIGEIFSSGRATLYKKPSDETVTTHGTKKPSRNCTIREAMQMFIYESTFMAKKIGLEFFDIFSDRLNLNMFGTGFEFELRVFSRLVNFEVWFWRTSNSMLGGLMVSFFSSASENLKRTLIICLEQSWMVNKRICIRVFFF